MQTDVADLDVHLEGQPLDFNEPEGPQEIALEELQRARTEEVSFMKRLEVWEASLVEKCVQTTGRPPLSTRLVDPDKGREGCFETRSRLVVRDFRGEGETRGRWIPSRRCPHMKAKRVQFWTAMLDGVVGGDSAKGGVKLMIMDIRKAHFNGKLAEDEYAYFQQPPGADTGIARLRQAASGWEEDYAKGLEHPRQWFFWSSRDWHTDGGLERRLHRLGKTRELEERGGKLGLIGRGEDQGGEGPRRFRRPPGTDPQLDAEVEERLHPVRGE